MSCTQNLVEERQTSTLRADAAEFVPQHSSFFESGVTSDGARPAKKRSNRQRSKRSQKGQDRSEAKEATAENEVAAGQRRTKNDRRRRKKGQRRRNNNHKGNKEDHHHQEETTRIPLHTTDAFPTLSSSGTASAVTKPPRWVDDGDRSMNLRQVLLHQAEDVQKQEPDPNEAKHIWKKQGLVMLSRKLSSEPAEELLVDEPPNFDCMEDEQPQQQPHKRKIPKFDMGKLRDRLWEKWDEHHRKQQFRAELAHKLTARYVPAEQFAKQKSLTKPEAASNIPSKAETVIIYPSEDSSSTDFSTLDLEQCINDDEPRQLLEILTAWKKRAQHMLLDPHLLLCAASLGREECLDLLLSQRDLISMASLTSTKDSEGNNLFHCACFGNNGSAHLLDSLFDFVGTSTRSQHQLLSKLLLAKNLPNHQTPLHLACQAGNVEVVNVFLNTCSSALLFKLFASQDDLGQTPLLTAVAANASDVVLALLLWNNGANTHHHPTRTTSSKSSSTMKSSSKLCPLAWAAGLGNTEMVCLLLEFSTIGSYDLTAALRSAVQGMAPVDCITTLLQAGANPFAVSSMNDGVGDSSTCIQIASGSSLEKLSILKTMATSGRKLLHERQRTRRADPVLQQQPESFFASLEREENFEMASALGKALLEALWNCCRSDSQDHLVIAAELFHCGAKLKPEALSKLRRAMVENDFVPVSFESLEPCALPFAFVSSYQHPFCPLNPPTKSTQLDDTNRSEALFWSRQLLQMPWMVELLQDATHISSCPVLNDFSQEEITDTMEPDVVLKTNVGEEFVVHSQILSTKCEKLGAAIRFRSNTDVDMINSVLEIPITMDSKLCKFFLQHIYHGSMSIGWSNDGQPSQNVSDLLELMLIGEEYICPSLIQECELRLLGAMIPSSQLGECVCPSCCKSIRISTDGGLPVAECLISVERERTSFRFPANLALDALAVIDQVEAVAGLGYRFNVSKTKATYTRSDVAWKLLENGSSEGGDSTLAATALLKDGILSFMLENFVRIVETPSFEENMQQGDDPKESQALLLRYCLEALRESPLTRLSNRENISPTTATKNRSK